jgi:hypothetical protein
VGRYYSSSYNDDREPPGWVKALLLLVLCGVVTALVRCAG